MAVGDVVSNITSVGAGARLSIQPGAGVEWVIHNIWVGSTTASFDLEIFDGANNLTVVSSGGGPLLISNMVIHVNNSIYPRVLNNDGNARLIAYDGVQTK
jgi:hypothetical protein